MPTEPGLGDIRSPRSTKHMIEALKSDELANRFGGRFKLCALIQRRLVQLMDGARPMVEAVYRFT